MMVYDKFQNGVIVCWILIEQWEACDIALVLKAVKKTAEEKRASLGLGAWSPNCWIVDCVDEEQKAIKYLLYPHVSIFLDLQNAFMLD